MRCHCERHLTAKTFNFSTAQFSFSRSHFFRLAVVVLAASARKIARRISSQGCQASIHNSYESYYWYGKSLGQRQHTSSEENSLAYTIMLMLDIIRPCRMSFISHDISRTSYHPSIPRTRIETISHPCHGKGCTKRKSSNPVYKPKSHIRNTFG